MSKSKPTPVPRHVVEGFYKALSARDFPAVASFLDDNVNWTISGPVDILPFCGQRHGKDVVIQLLSRDIPALLTGRRFVQSAMLVEDDRASILGKLSATLREDGRSISYRIAHFMRWENEKLVEYISLLDSFDAVEQMIGHSLDLRDHNAPACNGDLVSI